MANKELEKQRNIFAKNLRRYLEINDRTQLDLAKYISVSTATVSDWVNGKKLPRMDKIQAMADWFHINKTKLLEENTSDGNNDLIEIFEKMTDALEHYTISEFLEVTTKEEARQYLKLMEVIMEKIHSGKKEEDK